MHWPYGRLPVTAHPFVAVGPGTLTIVTGRGTFHGLLIADTAATGRMDIFDGPAATGQQIGIFSGTGDGRDHQFFTERGIAFLNGLTVVMTLGSWSGALYYIAETRLSEWIVDQESRAGIVGRHTQNWPDTVADMIGE